MSGIVRVTTHAYEQALARFPEEFPASDTHGAVCGRICSEVERAIKNGRMATRRPHWALRDGQTSRSDARRMGRAGKRTTHADGGPRARSHRYVWTADERRLYVVARKPSQTIVITVLGPYSQEAAA